MNRTETLRNLIDYASTYKPISIDGRKVFEETMRNAEVVFGPSEAEQRYCEALEKIRDFANGYGDVGGICFKIALDALRDRS
jgi:hypothetical protein